MPLYTMRSVFFFRFFFSSRRRHTRSVSAFLLNRSSDLHSFPQLDINNTIDHRPEGDEKWFLENEKTVKIGRASCRERVEKSGSGGASKKKKKVYGEARVGIIGMTQLIRVTVGKSVKLMW